MIKKPPGLASAMNVYGDYKRQAKTRNLEWDIDFEFFLQISKQNCYLCDEPPGNKANKKKYNGAFIYNGLDREDNTKGYTKKNVRPCCFKCNQVKSNKELRAVLIHISKMIAGLVREVI